MTNEEKLDQIFPGGICPFSKSWLDCEYKEPNKSENPTGSIIDWNNCHTSEQVESISTTKNNLAVDAVSRKAVQTRLKEIINEMETIFADIREREVNDSVCGLCEYDCDHGLDGFANECPGFEKDDCFKLNEKYKAEWLDISNLPSVTPQEPTIKNDYEKFDAVMDNMLKHPSTTKNDLEVDCIDRERLLKIYEDRYTELQRLKHLKDNKGAEDRQLGVNYCINILKEMPSITPQEPRKGHWIEEFNDLEGEVRFTCSSCGKYQLFGTDFCYHCGSDNREVVEE